MFEFKKQPSSKHYFRTSSSIEETLDSKLRRAESLYKKENFEEALKIYSELAESSDNSAFLLYRKGACLDYLGDKLKAMVCYLRSSELDPSNYLVHYAKGVIMHDRKHYEAAFESYSIAFALNPKYHAVCYKIGLIGSYFSKDEEAMILYQEAFSLEPTNILYLNLCGHAAYSTDRKQTAFNNYMRALELDPNDAACWSNNAIVAFELGKIGEAKTFLDKMLENPSRSIIDTLNEIAELPNSLDKYFSSKLDKQMPIGYVRSKAMILELLGEEALLKHKRAIEIDHSVYISEDPQEKIVYSHKDYYDAALLMYNEAIKSDPDDSITYYHQGKILYLREDYKNAIKCFNLALSLDISDLYSYLYNILSLYALDRDLEARTLFPALSTFGQEEEIIDFIADLSWEDDDTYIPKQAKILLDLALFSEGYSDVFNVFIEKNINFNLSVSLEDSTSLFVKIVQSENEWPILQVLEVSLNFEEILTELLMELDDSTCLEIIQKILSKSDAITRNIKEGKTKLLEVALSSFKPKVVEYLLGLNTKLIDQIHDRNIAGEFMIVAKNKELSSLLQEKFNFDLREKLQHAIIQNDTELVSNILIISPDLLDISFDDMPLGHWAVKQNKLDVIELILANDINLESKVDNSDHNLLTFALIQRKFEIIEVLMTKYHLGIGESMYHMIQDNPSRAIFNIPTSILQKALSHHSISKFLSHPNAALVRDIRDNTALHIAVMYAKEQFIEDYQVNLSKMVNEKNYDGQTPLHLLLNKLTGYFAQVKILEQLLEMQNIDIKIPDAEGFTAIDIAANFSPYALKRFFEKKLISIKELADPTYTQCLPFLMETEDVEIVKNEQKEILKSKYPLHYACLEGNEQKIINLLSHKENNGPDLWGYFPLYYAVCQKNLEAVKILSSRDNIDIIRASDRFNRTTILHTAIYQDDLDIIKCLFDKAISLEEGIANCRGQFHRALVHKIQSPETAAYLVNLFKKLTKTNSNQYKLLDLNEQDAYGHTPLYYASMLPDPKLMNYWFKLSVRHPEQYDINISLNQNLICNAALQGNIDIISYLLDRHGDIFNLDSKANDKLVEMSICGQGSRTIKFLFQNYPKSYLLVKDPARLKEMALFFHNQELSEYLDDARLISILSKHSELRLLEKIQEVEIKYQNELQEIKSKCLDMQDVTEHGGSGFIKGKSFERKLSALQKGLETIKEQQLKHNQIISLSGVDEKARVKEQLQFFKSSEVKVHDYCTAFYYGLSTYIITYKTLSSGAIQTTEDISNTAAKYGIRLFLKAGKAVSKGLPIVGSIVACLDLIVIGTYSTIQVLKLQNKIQMINEIVKQKAPLEDDLSLYIVKTAVEVSNKKAHEINTHITEKSKQLKWIENKLKNIRENVVGEDIMSTDSAALAMRDVGVIIANMYQNYHQIIDNDVPLDTQLISFVLDTQPATSPKRRDAIKRRSLANLYMYDKDPMGNTVQPILDHSHDKQLIAKDSMMSFATDSSDS